MSILKMTNIQKSFGDNHVLKDISLHVDKGEVVSIIGPSGSGKSTLLRCATFLETIDSGTITYDGKNAAEMRNGRCVYAKKLNDFRHIFGLVFQNFNLFPHYTVLKNMMDAPVSVMKRDKNEVREECLALLRKMGLEDKADSYQNDNGYCHSRDGLCPRRFRQGNLYGRRSDSRAGRPRGGLRQYAERKNEAVPSEL